MLNAFPELPMWRVAVQRGDTNYADNAGVTKLVESALKDLNLPADFIRDGDRVVLKPNWVKEHDERHPGPGQWEHVVTHPTVIEAVIRWTAARLPAGSITVCDAPQTDSSFRKLREYCDLDGMIDKCRKDFPSVKISLLDLRPEEWQAVDGVTVNRTKLAGDPLGSTHVALNNGSEFVDFRGQG